jgi:hypothetical protein
MIGRWSLVNDGIFHDFHTAWIAAIRAELNSGLLPNGFYALAEQHTGHAIADVLTLHADPSEPELSAGPSGAGGIAVADAPPRVRRHRTLEALTARQRSVAIRHASGHRLVALIEIFSRGNKDRPRNIDEFVDEAAEALNHDVNLLLIDLFPPPGPNDPYGIHEFIQQRFAPSKEAYDLPSDEPLTLAAYVAGSPVDAYLEHVAVGKPIPDMPLFLHPDRYINAPLEHTYASAYKGMPAVWRNVLERRA